MPYPTIQKLQIIQIVSNPLSNVGMETVALGESANIRLQDNRLSQNIILKCLILYEIQCEMKIL